MTEAGEAVGGAYAPHVAIINGPSDESAAALALRELQAAHLHLNEQLVIHQDVLAKSIEKETLVGEQLHAKVLRNQEMCDEITAELAQVEAALAQVEAAKES